jgi:hypothetical protein
MLTLLSFQMYGACCDGMSIDDEDIQSLECDFLDKYLKL